MNFDIGSAFSKCLGFAFSAGPGLGPLYKVCPLSHRFLWIYSAALPLPKKLTLLITSLLYLSSRWIRNHLVKVSTWLIPWVVTLRKSLTQEIRCETSPKWCAKKTPLFTPAIDKQIFRYLSYHEKLKKNFFEAARFSVNRRIVSRCPWRTYLSQCVVKT